jgi:nucleobase:cation symporter-1, NCS1 family
MAIVWNGVNAVQGGSCMIIPSKESIFRLTSLGIYVMLHSLTPHIANIPNVMGEGSALNSGGMIGFAVFWVLTCCFLIIPVPKVSYAV